MKKKYFLLSFLVLGFGFLYSAKNNQTMTRSTAASYFSTLLSQLYPDDSSSHSSDVVSTQKYSAKSVKTCEDFLNENGEECVMAYKLLDISSMVPNFDPCVSPLNRAVIKEAYSKKVQALKYWYAGVYASTKNEQLLGPALKGNCFKFLAAKYRSDWGELMNARNFLLLFMGLDMCDE